MKRNEIPEGWSVAAADFINKVKLTYKLVNIVFVEEAIK